MRTRTDLEEAADTLRTEDVSDEEQLIEFSHMQHDLLLDIRDLLEKLVEIEESRL